MNPSATRMQSRRLLARGVLQRQACEVCGEPNSEIHHPDYSLPKLVIWLCRGCHHAWHKSPAYSAALHPRDFLVLSCRNGVKEEKYGSTYFYGRACKCGSRLRYTNFGERCVACTRRSRQASKHRSAVGGAQ